MKVNNYNSVVAILFLLLTLAFLLVFMTSTTFFEWAFDRHHNQWSWYIRPLFLIPFCYFAYRRNLAGISITVFCLFTSMFWFSKPEVVSDDVFAFLQFEKDWLESAWDFKKLLLIATVPISFFALGMAFWKRSLLMGLGVLVLVATGKIIWSIQNAGESGKSIVIPAVLGLAICVGFLFWGYVKLEKKNKTK